MTSVFLSTKSLYVSFHKSENTLDNRHAREYITVSCNLLCKYIHLSLFVPVSLWIKIRKLGLVDLLLRIKYDELANICHLVTISVLTHWGRVTHIWPLNSTIIGSDNGLSPGRRQAIIWNNTGILLIVHIGRNFSEILIEIHIFSFKKMHLKMSSGKWLPF